MSIDFDEIRRRYADPDAFIRQLRDTMALHGISQVRLARRAGYRQPDMNRWLTRNDKRRVRPGLETMMKLDEAVEELIGSLTS